MLNGLTVNNRNMEEKEQEYLATIDALRGALRDAQKEIECLSQKLAIALEQINMMPGI